MSDDTLFLMEIFHPDHKESVCLMSGKGFEVLYEDKTGREVYGYAYEDKEYLFFPMTLNVTENGSIAVTASYDYEDSYLDQRADGSRVVLSSPYGLHFLADTYKNCISATGLLRVDSSGQVVINLDTTEKGKKVEKRDCDCSGGSLPSPTPPPQPFLDFKNDEELASLIRKRASEFNSVLRLAAENGLCVTLQLCDSIGNLDNDKYPEIAVEKIYKLL